MKVLLLVVLCVLMVGCTAAAESLYISALSADGVWTSPLVAGQTYEICTSGTYTYYYYFQSDAEWSWFPQEWHELSHFYGSPPPYDQDMLDLVIDGVAVDWLGGPNWTPHTYSPDHRYKYRVTGTGAPIHLWIADHYPFSGGAQFYHDNYGGLDVTVTAVPEPSSLVALGAGSIGLIGFLRRRRS